MVANGEFSGNLNVRKPISNLFLVNLPKK